MSPPFNSQIPLKPFAYRIKHTFHDYKRKVYLTLRAKIGIEFVELTYVLKLICSTERVKICQVAVCKVYQTQQKLGKTLWFFIQFY